MDKLYRQASFSASRLITETYSTSFSAGIRCLHPSIRDGIYGIYGFVRLADEIVDSFHEYDREELFSHFVEEYDRAQEKGISVNPVLNAFQQTVSRYGIPDSLVRSFLKSMEADLHPVRFGDRQIKEYIYGSAEAVGLMCLRVFVGGDEKAYEKLEPAARHLGAAFQKINFLRDLGHDTERLHRNYFPALQSRALDEDTKKLILDDIMEDYRLALPGILQLPSCARLGVYTAYLYYMELTRRIFRTGPAELLKKRIRVPNIRKMALLGKAYFHLKFSETW